ncbi:isoprenoid synthase domain-containing protein [Mycena capillaripes]|nr:isoprenoid synthase domain-containing protein [Mycena capillaripes]
MHINIVTFLWSQFQKPLVGSMDTVQNDDDLDLATIIQAFLDVVLYSPSNNPHIDKSCTLALEEAVDQEVRSWNVDDGHNGVLFAKISKKAVTLIQFWYSHLPFDAKLAFSLYAWFFFYIDDGAGKSSHEDYQRRLLLGRPQEDAALEHYQEVLGKLYDYWDPVCANAMACAALEFVSGTVLENAPQVSAMDVRPTAAGWPKYLRAKSGLGPAAACAVFPKKTHPDITAYIQVLPDIDDFSCLANDILSFYKEELAGENTNYVHVRSKTTLKHPKRVLVEMVQECADLHNRITATLEKQPEALAAWEAFENGFIAFHLSMGRYKLSELGFGCS